MNPVIKQTIVEQISKFNQAGGGGLLNVATHVVEALSNIPGTLGTSISYIYEPLTYYVNVVHNGSKVGVVELAYDEDCLITHEFTDLIKG